MASKHMVRSRNHARAIESHVKSANQQTLGAVEPAQVIIAADIMAMDNVELAKVLTHARRSCKVTPDRQKQLQAEWTKRLAALDDD